jgi:NADH-quinone oxidoreductase subunit J
MGETANLIVFYILAAVMIASSILAVTARRMLRAATYLFIVLICTAGLYLMLNYHFLAVVQLSVYAGGILILFIFAILLTSSKGEKAEKHDRRRITSGILTAMAGIVITVLVIAKNRFLYGGNTTIVGDAEIDSKEIGFALMGTDKYEYLLSFEALGILLLVCAIGAIVIARKR